ncbi:thioredoxin family protein [Hyunsoonleella ulvae]|uniref:thioredoxin family protein n=1 Tax=Hyunsoonleella ulvae TaxID=2799948 RepID=UPI001939315A|nr:thioredoxin family protein [Hyunsoonleella ulvae]
MLFKIKHIVFFLLLCISILPTFSQNEKINWLSWSQLENALKEEPKPVLIFFHADWCAYCKKMKRKVFTNASVIQQVNTDYYAVEMDVETKDTIVFDGVTFVNTEAEKKRNGIHELPLLLASREDKPFSLPAILLLDKNFQIKERIFEYYTSKQLLNTL